MNKTELRVLTPTGMLGYGFPASAFERGLEMKPDIIVVDAGSTDSGPQKLGLGSMTCSEAAYRRDLSFLLKATAERGIPTYVSSAGGDGTDAHVDEFCRIIGSLAGGLGHKFKTARIYTDVGNPLIKRRLAAGDVEPLGPVPQLADVEIDTATNIVAQIGVEPFIDALDRFQDLDLVIAGRAYDPSPLAAAGIRAGFDPALCWHMGKVMECGAACAEPQGKVIFGVLREDHFEVEPCAPGERCTVESVSTHTLYEKPHPYLLAGPGGTLDLSDSRYEQVSDRRVRVWGSRFVPSSRYQVKLEGAKPVGFRSIFIGGTKDKAFISQIDAIERQACEQLTAYFSSVPEDAYQVYFHLYGKNGVMGRNDPDAAAAVHELCVIVEVCATTQELATTTCSKLRTDLLHWPFEGKFNSGNLAHPFTPLEIPLGPVCVFNIYHLVTLSDPLEVSRIDVVEIGE